MDNEEIKEIEDLNLEPENRMEQILNGETLAPEDRAEYFVQKALGRFGPKPPTPTPSDEIFVVKAEVTAWDENVYYPTDFDVKTSAEEINSALESGKQIVLELHDEEWNDTYHALTNVADFNGNVRLLEFYVRWGSEAIFQIFFRTTSNNTIIDKRMFVQNIANWMDIQFTATIGNNCTLNQTWSKINKLQHAYTFAYVINQDDYYLGAVVTRLTWEDSKLVVYAVGVDDAKKLPYAIRLQQVGEMDSNEAMIEFLYTPSLPSFTAADAGKVLGIDENGNLAWVEK